jgi:hypothetical protein
MLLLKGGSFSSRRAYNVRRQISASYDLQYS